MSTLYVSRRILSIICTSTLLCCIQTVFAFSTACMHAPTHAAERVKADLPARIRARTRSWRKSWMGASRSSSVKCKSSFEEQDRAVRDKILQAKI